MDEQRTYTSLRDVGALKAHTVPSPTNPTKATTGGQLPFRGADHFTRQRPLLHRSRRLPFHDYTRKRGVVHTEIMLPDGAAPWLSDRAKLWNHAQARETRKDSQLAREINLALPHELDDAQRLDLLRDFVRTEFVAKGMAADIAVHAPVADRGDDPRNHHAHIMLTLRQAGPDGLFKTKTRAWNTRDELKAWRDSWEQQQNRALARANQRDRVNHRSLADQRAVAMARGDTDLARALDRLPEIHVGPAAYAMHEQHRLPTPLRPMPVPPPVFPAQTASPPPSPVSSVPLQTLLDATATFAPSAACPPDQPRLPVLLRVPGNPLLASAPQPPPRSRPATVKRSERLPKRFVQDTWWLSLVPRIRHAAPRRDSAPPLLRLVLRETRPHAAWRKRLERAERYTRLEFNLWRLERNRTKAGHWVRHVAGRLARFIRDWPRWRRTMAWLMARSDDPALTTRLLKRIQSEARIRTALAAAVRHAQAEESRLRRRVYELRLKLHRELLAERRRGRQPFRQNGRTRHRSASDPTDP